VRATGAVHSTYAQAAREGFCQLLAVAAITMATLLALRAATDIKGLVALTPGAR
jgi:hypothetical protein